VMQERSSPARPTWTGERSTSSMCVRQDIEASKFRDSLMSCQEQPTVTRRRSAGPHP
jgi:hypothetical protein